MWRVSSVRGVAGSTRPGAGGLQARRRLRAPLAHLILGQVLVVAEDAHAQRAREAGHAAAHVAQTDDAESLAGQFLVEGVVAGAPVAVAGPAIHLNGAPGA
jgi:hypothetical protein